MMAPIQGRYRSILIDQDSYLLDLIRYIHRNPFESGIEKDFGQYPWSSLKGYISNAKKSATREELMNIWNGRLPEWTQIKKVIRAHGPLAEDC